MLIMKFFLLCATLICATFSTVTGKIYKITEEDEALQYAQEMGKAVAYVFGWSSWAPLVAAREAAIINANSYFVVISVGFNSEFYQNASPLVASQIESIKKVLVSPQVIVVSNDGNKFLGHVSKANTAKKVAYSDVKKAVDAYLEDRTLPKQPTDLIWYITKKGTYYTK